MNEVLEREIEQLLEEGKHNEALHCAMAGYGPEFRGYLVRILRHADLADDAFARTWEDIWNGLPRFRRTCAFRTWAYRIASNAAARVRNGQRQLTPLDSTLEATLAAAAASSGQRRMSEQRSQLEEVRKALSDEDEELLVLRVDRRLPWDDIAVILSTEDAPITAAALRNRFDRLKKKIKEKVQTTRR